MLKIPGLARPFTRRANRRVVATARLAMCCGVLTSLVLSPGIASADSISLQVVPGVNAGNCTFAQPNPPTPGEVATTSGTATTSVTCTTNVGEGGLANLAMLSGSSSINTIGGSISITGAGLAGYEDGQVFGSYSQNVSFSGVGATACPVGTGVYECYAGGSLSDPQPGTPLDAVFTFTNNGTSSGAIIELTPELQVALNGPLSAVAVGGKACAPCYVMDTTNTGTVSSVPYTFYTGATFTESVYFSLTLQCSLGGCSTNFGDPALTDVTITDPSTGLPVLGLNMVGDDGTVYPTNVGIAGPTPSAAVPEPSPVGLVALGLMGLGFLRYRNAF